MKYDKDKACKECPFRKGSMRGYVGPYENATELVSTALHVPFPCHMTMGSKNEQACYGAAVMCRRQMSVSRNGALARYQQSVDKDDPTIMSAQEAREYHSYWPDGVLKDATPQPKK